MSEHKNYDPSTLTFKHILFVWMGEQIGMAYSFAPKSYSHRISSSYRGKLTKPQGKASISDAEGLEQKILPVLGPNGKGADYRPSNVVEQPITV